MITQDGYFESINPATGELLGRFQAASRAQVNEVVGKAGEAQVSWSRLSFAERAQYMHGIKRAIQRRKEELIDVLTREVGKPRMEALIGDIFFSLQDLDYHSKNAERQLRDEKLRLGMEFRGVDSRIVFQPAGVVGIILPWNYPFNLATRTLVPALMAGNTVVLKASEYTPLCMVKLFEVIQDAGLPEGVVNLLLGGDKTGQYLVESDIDRVVFTGSTSTGKQVMRTAAKKLHPVILELGGKNPAIVCGDADLEAAAAGVVWSTMINTGQACANIERVYVVEDIAEEFTEKVVERVKRLRVGNGLDPDVDVGPSIAEFQYNHFVEHIEDAREKGARVMVGGEPRCDLGPLFYAPTVLAGVDHSMRVMREETFGPVISIMTARDLDEAVELANDSEYGLTGYIWTRSKETADGIALRLKVGHICVNNRIEAPHLAFGGVKNSGMGRTGSRYGVLHYVDLKNISHDFTGKEEQDWWYPYSSDKLDYFLEVVSGYHGEDLVGKAQAMIKLARGYKPVDTG